MTSSKPDTTDCTSTNALVAPVSLKERPELPASGHPPAAKREALQRRTNERESMIDSLASLVGIRLTQLTRRIRYATDVQSLWFLRTVLMALLASAYGETAARQAGDCSLAPRHAVAYRRKRQSEVAGDVRRAAAGPDARRHFKQYGTDIKFPANSASSKAALSGWYSVPRCGTKPRTCRCSPDSAITWACR